MNSFMGWIGGKRNLRKQIIEQFPCNNIERYIEVFGGAGWILFAKEKFPDQMEVFNDIDDDLINLFRCTKYHCAELQRELTMLPTSRTLFYDYKEQLNSSGLTDIQRAARYLYLIKISFGSSKSSFATTAKSIDNTIDYLLQIQKRLHNVIIENRDFADLIKVYDRQNALFYLDPPYFETEKYYHGTFKRDDHQRLKEILSNIQGKFLLSYNDVPFIRDLYSEFNIQSISRYNLLSGDSSNRTIYPELIIKNY